MLKAFTTTVFLAFVMAMAPDAFASMTYLSEGRWRLSLIHISEPTRP